MKLRFDFTIDDWIAWTVHYDAHSKPVQSIIQKRRVWFTAIAFSMFMLIGFAFAPTHWLSFLVIGVIAAIAMLCGSKDSTYSERRRQMLKMYSGPEHDDLFGWKELDILKHGLLGRSENGETTTYWAGIHRVDETDSHAFIYLNTITAYVIPKAQILPDDLGAFLEQVRQEVELAESNRKGKPDQ